MTNIFFTSDTHFGHEAMITKGWRPGFSSVKEMDEWMIESWNYMIGPKDQVWHLGDFAMGTEPVHDPDHLLSQLHGEVHLITGNHDAPWPGHRQSHKHQRKWLDAGFASVQAFARRRIAGRQVLLSHFPYVGDHTEGDRYNEYRLSNKGLPLIHGHVHEEWQVRGNQINVGVDAWGFRPLSIDKVAEILGSFG